MSNAVIMVGIDGWQEFTWPAITSFQKHDDSTLMVVVDAASRNPYPKVSTLDRKMIRLDRSDSYAYAINNGILSSGRRDWYLVVNNDVIFEGPIPFDKLDPGLIHTRQVITEDGHTWMGLWIAAISRQVWDTVGKFDEKFLLCGFEDADYCIRAKDLGIDTVHYPFPVRHLWGKTRWGLPHYAEVREDNINYFASKHGFRLGTNMQVIHD